MSKRTDAEFEKLATETSQAAAAIDCTQADYRAGLRSIIQTLEMDIQASEETDKGTDDDVG